MPLSSASALEMHCVKDCEASLYDKKKLKGPEGRLTSEMWVS